MEPGHLQPRFDIHVHQDERLIRSMVLMGNTLAEQAETINNLEQAMSALSDAIDQLVARIDSNDQADKARIADLEQQLSTSQADTQAQVDRLNALENAGTAANPNDPNANPPV
jgi:polyhydroxyalkanoate synthesis regulator phasin